MFRKQVMCKVFMVTIGMGMLYPVPCLMAQERIESDGGAAPTNSASELPASILFPSDAPEPYIPPHKTSQQTPLPDYQTPDETFSAPTTLAPKGNPENNMAATEETSKGDVLDVETLLLPEKHPAEKGLLMPTTGGFPENLWQGSSLGRIQQLLTDLSPPTKSPVMAGLTKKLLLSAVTAPAVTSPNGEIAAGQAKEDALRHFLSLKIHKIAERGDLKSLAFFLKILPPESYDITQETSDLMLLAGDVSSACLMARRAMDNNQVNIYWLKVLAYCQTMEGNNDGAALTSEQLMEQGETDFVFYDLVNRLSALKKRGGRHSSEPVSSDQSVSSEPASDFGPLDGVKYSLLSVLELPININEVTDASPLVLYALTSNANIKKDDRLMAAAQSFQKGSFPVKDMIPLYNMISFPDEAFHNILNNTVSITSADDTVMGDVLLYQSAAKATNSLQKAEILAAISERALLKQDLPRAAILNIKTVASLEPSPELLLHAHHIARALLLGGEDEKAKAWYDFTRTAAISGNVEATQILMEIWPMMVTAGIIQDENNTEIIWSKDILDLWWNSQTMVSPEQRQEKAALFYTIAEAFDFAVPESMWQQLISPQISHNNASKTGPDMERRTRPIPIALWRSLIQSISEKKLGETLLLCLLAKGDMESASLDPTGVGAVIRALRASGLDSEARHFALETLTNNGF